MGGAGAGGASTTGDGAGGGATTGAAVGTGGRAALPEPAGVSQPAIKATTSHEAKMVVQRWCRVLCMGVACA